MRGDVVRVRPGDQVVVDGPLVDGAVEVDESLLTGEADAQRRAPGEDLLSGSHCVGGAGLQQARDVGAASYANRLTAEARRATTDTTPLQRRIAFVIRLTMLLVVLMSGAILLQAALEGFTLLRVVQTSAVLSGLVPYGLFFLIALAYTAGAVASAREGALVQRVNAVESVSNVDVVCTDKTGTLTTGRLTVTEVAPVGGHAADDVTAALGSMARSATAPNLTSTALAARFPGETVPVREEVPFSSALRWSALRTDDATWVLGAPEALAPSLPDRTSPADVRARTAQGLRVLVFARAADPEAPLRDGDGRPVLPPLDALAVVALADELRPDVPPTLARFRKEGIALKVLSGDDPDTVAALAARAGLEDTSPVHAGRLHELSDDELDSVVAGGAVFGRVAPEQKERIVHSLRRQGALRGHGRGRRQRCPRPQGRPGRRGHAQRQRRHPRRGRHRAGRGLAERTAAGPSPGPPHHQRHRHLDPGVPRPGRHAGPGHHRGHHARPGLPVLPGAGRADAVHRRAADAASSPPGRVPSHRIPTCSARWAASSSPLPCSPPQAGSPSTPRSTRRVASGFVDGRVPAGVIREFEGYTGLTYGIDADFTDAAATIGAQTGLSTFVSLASVLLILFLAPPNRLFAAVDPPDRRQAPRDPGGRAARRPRRRAVHPRGVGLLRADRCRPARLQHGAARAGDLVRASWVPPTGSGCSTGCWVCGSCRRRDRACSQRMPSRRPARCRSDDARSGHGRDDDASGRAARATRTDDHTADVAGPRRPADADPRGPGLGLGVAVDGGPLVPGRAATRPRRCCS